MTKSSMTYLALALAFATAVTAATAFADVQRDCRDDERIPDEQLRLVCRDLLAKDIASQTSRATDKATILKLRNAVDPQQNVPRVAAPPRTQVH